MKRNKILLAGSLCFSLMLYQLGFCQAPNTSAVMGYYIQAAQVAHEKINDPLFVKPFIKNAHLPYRYVDLTYLANFYVDNGQYDLPLPMNLSNFAGTSTTVIANNAFLNNKLNQLYKELPSDIYNANSNWLSMQQVYSHPIEYDFLPQFGHTFFLGFCQDINCNSGVSIIYNIDNNDVFGYAVFDGIPPQIYLMNVNTLQKAALVLTIYAYIAAQQQIGTFAQWMAQHPMPAPPPPPPVKKTK